MKGTLGSRIRQVRERLGMTQGEVADKLGTTKQHVYRWEKGLSKPSYENLQGLAAVLDTTIGTLYGEPDAESEALARYITEHLDGEVARNLLELLKRPGLDVYQLLDVSAKYAQAPEQWRQAVLSLLHIGVSPKSE